MFLFGEPHSLSIVVGKMSAILMAKVFATASNEYESDCSTLEAAAISMDGGGRQINRLLEEKTIRRQGQQLLGGVAR